MQRNLIQYVTSASSVIHDRTPIILKVGASVGINSIELIKVARAAVMKRPRFKSAKQFISHGADETVTVRRRRFFFVDDEDQSPSLSPLFKYISRAGQVNKSEDL